MHWTIVPYTPLYAEPLRHLYLQARQTAFTWQSPAQFTLADFDHATAGEHLLVALHQQVPIGFIAWWPPDNFIHSLFIAPAWQQHGVGKALLHAGLTQMGRPATLKCLLANASALRFYSAQGWTIAGTDADASGPYYLLSFMETV